MREFDFAIDEKMRLIYLLSDDNIEVVLSLVNVGSHGDDAGDTSGVGLAGSHGGSVHDTVLGVTEEVGGTTETVQHTRTHDTGAVGVGIDVDLDGSVHTDDTQTTDDLRRVGDLLGSEEQLAGVALPVVVETLESVGGETDGGGRGEVQVAAVEEVQERVLEHLSPDLQVAEVGTALAQTANDGVGNVTNAGLDGQQVLGQTAVLDLVLQELDQVAGNTLGDLVLGSDGRGHVGVVGLDNGDDLLGVDGDVGGTDTVLRSHDQVGLAAGGEIRHGDVVQTLERRAGRVHLDNDLFGHLDELGRGTHGRSGNDTTIGGNGRSLNDGHIELVARLVLGVPALLSLLVSHSILTSVALSSALLCRVDYLHRPGPRGTCSDACRRT